MPELLLEGIEPPAVVQEVDGVTVAEQVGVAPHAGALPTGLPSWRQGQVADIVLVPLSV